MDNYQSLSHTRWECKYHVVFVPKCRRNVLYGHIRKKLGKVLAELARHNESCIEVGGLQPDHVHMVISIPPKNSVAHVIGYIKGKSAIHMARGPTPVRKGTSPESSSGREDTLYPPSAEMNGRSKSMSAASRRKTVE